MSASAGAGPDPIQRHPTRAEQLDILASIVGDLHAPGDRLLDLGCGTGYVAELVFGRAPELEIFGVDVSDDALAAASQRFAGTHHVFTPVPADLRAPGRIPVPEGAFRFIVSCLTFHDLNEREKRALLEWAAGRLARNGMLLLYDRIRLVHPALFPAQQAIWRRLERVHGRGMRDAPDFAAYEADLGPKNDPAPLLTYLEWLTGLGLEAAPLHLHGNIALIGAARGRARESAPAP